MAPKHTAKEILDQFYDAERVYMSSPLDQRDSTAMRATLSPTIKLFQTPDLLYGGEYTGVEQWMKWGEEMSSLFDAVDVQPSNILEDDDVVVILGRSGRTPFVKL